MNFNYYNLIFKNKSFKKITNKFFNFFVRIFYSKDLMESGNWLIKKSKKN